jgi:uncharacterized glyoxalase superfamily protein PhnB
MATINDYRTVTPYLVVADANAELEFLEKAFGATVTEAARDDNGRLMHAEIRIGDSLVMMGQAGGEVKPLNAALYMWLENVDEVYARALAAGAKSEREPADREYGHRVAGVIDSNGIAWWIGSPVK